MVPPPPPSIPPPPPAHAHEDDSVASDDDEEGNDGRIDANMETPLIGHGSRRPRHKNKNGTFRNTLQTCYSSINDVEGGTTTDDEEGSSKNKYNITNAHHKEQDDILTDDDDYSLSDASISSISTTLTNFRDNLMLPFTSDETSLPKIGAGMASLTIVGIVLGLAMPAKDMHGRWYPWWGHISSVIGYTYFVLWSVCFYPQVLLNMRRQSTRGLSNDFAILNFMGWSFYSAYLASMYFDESIQELYTERFKNESSTVKSNDVAFSIHAMILSFIYLVQIVYYGGNGFSLPLKPQTWFLVVGMGGPTVIIPLLIWTGIWEYESWLNYFYMLSFFKICCTLTKYSKQVLLNWKRKSTSGWNIWYNFLECSGGALSMMQIVLDSVNMNDMSGITGNMAKFALGLATIFFDVSPCRFFFFDLNGTTNGNNG